MRVFSVLVAMLATALLAVAQDPLPYPRPAGKKGLQVQMVDDALALGIQHAALNVNLGQLLPRGEAATISFERAGRQRQFAAGYVAELDRQVEPLAAAGVVVSAILLAIRTGVPELDAVLVHRCCTERAPNGIGAFATDHEAGRQWLGDAVAFLAARYSGAAAHGRIWNWIVGNEVNSHHWWYHMGEASLGDVVEAYEAAVRIVHGAVREHSAHGRVFVSLEHHWAKRYAAGSERQAVPGRDLLLAFAARAKARGDFDWHVAFHPYPEDLFDCRFWQDETAPDHDEAARVTFLNLPVLLRRLAKNDLRYGAEVRRVILSEQGFHCRDGERGEIEQAAAFALAATIVDRLRGIDAFVLHRHVDHAHEGGLQLGLWTRRQDSVCTPERRRKIAEVFAAWGTEAFAAAAGFALPIVGLPAFADFPLGSVRAELDGDDVQVTVDGAPFATVRTAALPRPFVWPLLGPDGVRRTRNFPMASGDGEEQDHPHHQSMWFAHGALNGFDFWHGKGHRERQVRSSAPQVSYRDGAAEVVCDYRWTVDDDRVLADERRTWRFGDRDGVWVADLHTELRSAGAHELVFGDTKEGTFALRVHPQLRVAGKVARGRLVDAEGRVDGKVWGNRAAWLATSGLVDGQQIGLAIFDHPDNHGFPTHWHARTYGLLASNPFGLHDFGKGPVGAGELRVAAGATLCLRYRVVLFAGEWSAAQTDALGKRW